jgi:hypothetical protein
VGEVVARAAKARTPDPGLLTLALANVTAHNASGRTDLGQYTSHPVLFPPGVWSPGKDNLPWSLALSCLSLERAGPAPALLLAPLSTACTLGSSPGQGRGEALCLHADISPLELSLDATSIACLASVGQALAKTVLQALPRPPPAPALQTGAVPGPAPALLHRSLGSVSESATPVTSGQHSLGPGAAGEPFSPGPASLWLQWTLPLAALSLSLPGETVRLALEDCSASLDRQPHYSKVQLRVRALSGFLQAGGSGPGPFPGRLLSCRPLLRPLYAYSPAGGVEALDGEEEPAAEGRGVLRLTLTCAEVPVPGRRLRAANGGERGLIEASGPTRFLTELDGEAGPVDAFLPTRLLQPLLTLLQPLASLQLPARPGPAPSLPATLLRWNSSTLPMLYLKTGRLRLFLLEEWESPPDALVPDFLLLQLERIAITAQVCCQNSRLNSYRQVENPLSRILVDVPLYHEAGAARLLGLPGSLVEDRQYQADIAGITVATGG